MTDSAHLDAVAKAIFEATERALPDAFPWEKLTAPEQSDWRRMAQAAIDALQLTEEWAIQAGVNISRSMSENAAKSKAAMWPESFDAVRRLASPWLRVDGGDA